jgi:ribosomal protein S18 acetylase RimI-like enzyme
MRYEFDAPLLPAQLADLRESVGWDRREEQYARLLGHTHFSLACFDGEQLVGYLDVLSDGVEDAFIRDLMVHREYQRRGIGTRLLNLAQERIRAAGIRSVGVIFEPELAAFYRQAGFHVVAGGVMDNEAQQ